MSLSSIHAQVIFHDVPFIFPVYCSFIPPVPPAFMNLEHVNARFFLTNILYDIFPIWPYNKLFVQWYTPFLDTAI